MRVPYRNLGANEWVFFRAGNPTAKNLPQSLAIAAVGKPAELPLVADSMYILFNDPRRIAAASHKGNRWFDVPNFDAAARDPQNARHSGGATIMYGDGHAKWIQQGGLGVDPNSGRRVYPNTYKLPVNPSTVTRGTTTIPADDRLQ